MPDHLIKLAKVTGVHGLKGELVVHPYSGESESLTAYGPLYDEKGREFKLTLRFAKGKSWVCAAEHIATRSEAEAIGKPELYADEALFADLQDGEFYHKDLIGLPLVDDTSNTYGHVKAVLNYGAGDLLEIDKAAPEAGHSATIVIPFTHDIDIQPQNQRLVVTSDWLKNWV